MFHENCISVKGSKKILETANVGRNLVFGLNVSACTHTLVRPWYFWKSEGNFLLQIVT